MARTACRAVRPVRRGQQRLFKLQERLLSQCDEQIPSTSAAGELTLGNTIRTSLTFLDPSQGLADTEFRNVRSTRSVASQRLTVRTLCMPLSVPT